ncbi:putative nuclease [Tieghemostelium lacteum]|uniref:Putative nuclease n=1 Tax=Tieghemostelium lacteum TaxID=361077 RepID=A0A151ZBK4_TIELA|nr:putative nuclease [Tieghemostelium lacteum]|eukprot:KYQ91264.1 putative nuclease [Tieghemostelium lacteum]
MDIQLFNTPKTEYYVKEFEIELSNSKEVALIQYFCNSLNEPIFFPDRTLASLFNVNLSTLRGRFNRLTKQYEGYRILISEKSKSRIGLNHYINWCKQPNTNNNNNQSDRSSTNSPQKQTASTCKISNNIDSILDIPINNISISQNNNNNNGSSGNGSPTSSPSLNGNNTLPLHGLVALNHIKLVNVALSEWIANNYERLGTKISSIENNFKKSEIPYHRNGDVISISITKKEDLIPPFPITGNLLPYYFPRQVGFSSSQNSLVSIPNIPGTPIQQQQGFMSSDGSQPSSSTNVNHLESPNPTTTTTTTSTNSTSGNNLNNNNNNNNGGSFLPVSSLTRSSSCLFSKSKQNNNYQQKNNKKLNLHSQLHISPDLFASNVDDGYRSTSPTSSMFDSPNTSTGPSSPITFNSFINDDALEPLDRDQYNNNNNNIFSCTNSLFGKKHQSLPTPNPETPPPTNYPYNRKRSASSDFTIYDNNNNNNNNNNNIFGCIDYQHQYQSPSTPTTPTSSYSKTQDEYFEMCLNSKSTTSTPNLSSPNILLNNNNMIQKSNLPVVQQQQQQQQHQQQQSPQSLKKYKISTQLLNNCNNIINSNNNNNSIGNKNINSNNNTTIGKNSNNTNFAVQKHFIYFINNQRSTNPTFIDCVVEGENDVKKVDLSKIYNFQEFKYTLSKVFSLISFSIHYNKSNNNVVETQLYDSKDEWKSFYELANKVIIKPINTTPEIRNLINF